MAEAFISQNPSIMKYREFQLPRKAAVEEVGRGRERSGGSRVGSRKRIALEAGLELVCESGLGLGFELHYP